MVVCLIDLHFEFLIDVQATVVHSDQLGFRMFIEPIEHSATDICLATSWPIRGDCTAYQSNWHRSRMERVQAASFIDYLERNASRDQRSVSPINWNRIPETISIEQPCHSAH